MMARPDGNPVLINQGGDIMRMSRSSVKEITPICLLQCQ